jgi:hypothetical protein
MRYSVRGDGDHTTNAGLRGPGLSRAGWAKMTRGHCLAGAGVRFAQIALRVVMGPAVAAIGAVV